MKTYHNKYLSFLFLLLAIACTKNVKFLTEIEFELLAEHSDEGFVNQGQGTTFTVVPEADLEGYEYGLNYKILKGKGYFEDASGKRWDINDEFMLTPKLATTLMYVGTEIGEHRLQITASDNFVTSEEIELSYNLENVPVQWEAISKVSQIELGMSADIDVVLAPKQTETELTYEARYSLAKGKGTLVPTQQNAPGIATNYEAMPFGTYNLSFTPSKLGSQELVFTLKNNNGRELVTKTNFEVIEATNTPPTAEDFLINLPENTTNNLIPLATHINDTNGDTLTVSISNAPSNGTATVSGTTISYTPNSDYEGADSIVYTVNDGNGGTATATVDITVTQVNRAPVAVNDVITNLNGLSSTTFEVLGNDTDPDGDTISLITSFTQPNSGGTIELVLGANGANSAFEYIPSNPTSPTGYTEQFTYTITDGNLVSSSATVTLEVNAPGTFASFSPREPIVTFNDPTKTGTVTIYNGSMRFAVNAKGGSPITIPGSNSVESFTTITFSIGDQTISVSAPGGESSFKFTKYFPPGTYNYTLNGVNFSGLLGFGKATASQ